MRDFQIRLDEQFPSQYHSSKQEESSEIVFTRDKLINGERMYKTRGMTEPLGTAALIARRLER